MLKTSLTAAIITLALASPLWPQQKVAFTWDDLPVHGALPPGETRQQVIDALINTIKLEHMPAPYGFVNAKQIDAQPDLIGVLDAWRKAGFPLGNHTWSHLNLNASTTVVGDWEAEVLKNEPILKREMGGADFHWLRFPNLSEGGTDAGRLEARRFLAAHGYKIAGVTMSFADYAYNDPYARCMTRGDNESVKKLEDSYLEEAQRNLDYAHKMSVALYGHDIPYILLMHVGALDAELLPGLLEVYRRNGVTFISLQEAVQDPFYRNDLDLSLTPVPDTLEEAMHLKGLALPKRDPVAVNLQTLCVQSTATKP